MSVGAPVAAVEEKDIVEVVRARNGKQEKKDRRPNSKWFKNRFRDY